MNNPIVSIVIPCYNDVLYIEDAVNSAINQTYPYTEIIVVDDGSNKETKSVLKTLEPKISRLITQENKGQSAARNAGIKASKGEYIFVLDSDDYFEIDFVRSAIEILIKNVEVKIVTSKLRRFNQKGTIDYVIPQGGNITSFVNFNGATGCCMFRKEDALSVGGYDEIMRKGWEDWEFYIRLLSKGGSAYVLKDCFYNYRIRDNSTTHRANKNKIELYNYIYSKNWNIISQHKENFINFIYEKIIYEQNQSVKIKNKLEFKLGELILKPIKFLNKLLK